MRGLVAAERLTPRVRRAGRPGSAALHAGAAWLQVNPWLALFLVFLLSLPAVTTRLYASDEIEYFAYLRSVWFDGDLRFENEYRYFYDRGIARDSGFKATFVDASTATGHQPNYGPVGTAILWAPFYLAADGGVRAARWLDSDVPADGFSRPYIAAITYGSALYGFLALVLSGCAARRVAGAGAGTLLAVWVGTPLLFYMYVAPGFSHAASAFSVAAFVAAWLVVRRHWSWGGVAALGALAAVMGMVREQDLFIAVGPAVDYVVTAARSIRSGRRPPSAWIGRALAGLAAAAVCYAPQAAAYIVLYGRFGPSPLSAQKMAWTSPNAWRVLVSPENGLLFWTPLALPALVGLACIAFGRWGRSRDAVADAPSDTAWVGFLCLLMVATEVYVSGCIDTWAAAGSFGQRRLIGLTVFLALGLGGLGRVVTRRGPRVALAGIVALCVWWNVGLIVQFGSGLMSRQHLHLHSNAYHNFVTIPRTLPALAYRYFFDRGSFYRQPVRALP